MRIMAEGLRFPEGPVELPDGSLLVVEIAGGAIAHIEGKGKKSNFCDIGGGPNGAALGPGGKLFVCNNGGLDWVQRDGIYRPTWNLPADYTSGRIEVVDLDTRKVETLYDRCGDRMLSAPNDLVFDGQDGFWFTDSGKYFPEHRVNGGIYWARADGSEIKEVVYRLEGPNGIGISPDGATLYVAETSPSRLWAWDITGPGEIRRQRSHVPHGGRLVMGYANFQRFDSLAVSASGKVNVATLVNGGISEIWPDGSASRHHPIPDTAVTNICFGGKEMRTAFITMSHRGLLASLDWHEPGLPLPYQR
jgi:gluconolactonase